MNIKTGIKIHNRFDIEVKDALTGEVLQKAQAENIVLDRMYTRLLAYSTYFVNIVFGSGTGTLSAARTSLFTKVGSKAATTDQLVLSYPTSVWTRTIRLGTDEFNGNILREIGISDDATLINTHAVITDSEGTPISVEKTSLKIIDIYATVFIEIYDVDSGLFFLSNELRSYLTGGSAPASNLRLYHLSDDDATTLTATKTTNATEKSVTVAVRFNVEHFNKDVKFIDWPGMGLRCKLPRTGVFTSMAKTAVELGTGNGSNTIFQIPNRQVSAVTVKVDGVTVSNYTINVNDQVVFDTAPANGLLVTADYTCNLIPKDSNHVLDITMKMAFGGGVPTPVVSDPDYSGLPGASAVIAGTSKLGYFGVVSDVDLISGADLCTAIGLTAGTLINSTAGWFKYAHNGEIMFVAKKPFRHTVSWDDINAVGAVFGQKTVEIDGNVYAVRLLSSAEWDRLIYPIHVNYGQWARFSDADIVVTSGDGRATWTSTPSSSDRVHRGGASVSYSNGFSPSGANSYYGFRPCLVFLRPLNS